MDKSERERIRNKAIKWGEKHHLDDFYENQTATIDKAIKIVVKSNNKTQRGIILRIFMQMDIMAYRHWHAIKDKDHHDCLKNDYDRLMKKYLTKEEYEVFKEWHNIDLINEFQKILSKNEAP